LGAARRGAIILAAASLPAASEPEDLLCLVANFALEPLLMSDFFVIAMICILLRNFDCVRRLPYSNSRAKVQGAGTNFFKCIN
jgi:hypothetical protein